MYASSEGSDESVSFRSLAELSMHKNIISITLSRLAQVFKTIFHQCVISYSCSQSNSDGSVLKQSHQSKTGYKYMVWFIGEKLF